MYATSHEKWEDIPYTKKRINEFKQNKENIKIPLENCMLVFNMK